MLGGNITKESKRTRKKRKGGQEGNKRVSERKVNTEKERFLRKQRKWVTIHSATRGRPSNRREKRKRSSLRKRCFEEEVNKRKKRRKTKKKDKIGELLERERRRNRKRSAERESWDSLPTADRL